ncbi:MAG: amidase [Micromonosporaceae bacterium]|nr:amidase [Micromonosporaceae bacterium]
METSIGTAIGIAADVRAGRRSVREVVDACLARIEAEDSGIGAFQVVAAEAARREADVVAGRKDLADLPLAGVPVAIKDNVDVAGLPTRYGSAATDAELRRADDLLVVRLREAGAVVVGKTRLPELAIWGFTESKACGGTRSPRDPRRNAGGSTGGGAAAVANGFVPLALGSDGGGSLRIPAANCGVVGFKPGPGVVPLAGGLAEHWFGCSAFGPVTATVADAALALDVLAGTERWRDPVPPTRPLRVAVSLRSPSPIGPADAESRRAVAAAADRMRAAGHTVVEADPRYSLTLANVWVQRWLAGVAMEVDQLGLDVRALEPRTRTMVAKGRRLLGRGRPRPADAERWRNRVLAWFDSFDVLVSPVIARPAPPAGWATDVGYLRAYLNGARGVPYTQAWNVAGFPAMSLPMPGTPERPGAVQIVAPAGEEATVLSLAVQLEAADAR